MVLVISKQPFVFMWWIIDVQESKDLHGHIYINHTWEIIIMLCMPFLEHVFVYYLSRGWMYPEHVHIYDRRDGQCSVCLHGRHGHERRLMSAVVFFNPLRPSLFYFILFSKESYLMWILTNWEEKVGYHLILGRKKKTEREKVGFHLAYLRPGLYAVGLGILDSMKLVPFKNLYLGPTIAHIQTWVLGGYMIGSEKRFELMDYVVNLLIIGSNKFFFFVNSVGFKHYLDH